MAKPRVFISSTFYDLKQTRIELDNFIKSLGYDTIRNEEGDIPYQPNESLQQSCFKEIPSSDVLISIIGGRFGSTAIDVNEAKTQYSVSQMELKTAIENDKQVFIFIEANVLSEYETYLLNRDNENVAYRYVDNVAIYKFIEEIKSLSRNNNIKGFSSVQDITKYLKEQFAGIMQKALSESSLKTQYQALKDIKETAKTLHELVDYFKEQSKENENDVIRILRVDHPLIKELKKKLNIEFNFYIEGRTDLIALLLAIGFNYNLNDDEWYRTNGTEHQNLSISAELFDKNGNLVYMKHDDWKSDYVKYSKYDASITDDELPF